MDFRIDECPILDISWVSSILFPSFQRCCGIPRDFPMIFPLYPWFPSRKSTKTHQDLAEQVRQFHTVTEIVRKHRETAKNKSLGPALEKNFILVGGGWNIHLYFPYAKGSSSSQLTNHIFQRVETTNQYKDATKKCHL